jgi:hypothetical protein
MVYYILKFVNEIVLKAMSKKDGKFVVKAMADKRYNNVVEVVKSRLQESFYQL